MEVPPLLQWRLLLSIILDQDGNLIEVGTPV